MRRITDSWQELLQNITGKTVTGSYNTMDELLTAYNHKYVCEVTFSTTPADATIVVKKGTSVIAPENGHYYLKEGSYTYDASAEGYTAKENQSLTITNSDEATGTKTVTVTLSAVVGG